MARTRGDDLLDDSNFTAFAGGALWALGDGDAAAVPTAQRDLVEAVGRLVVGVDLSLDDVEPLPPEALASAISGPLARTEALVDLVALEHVTAAQATGTPERIEQIAVAFGDAGLVAGFADAALDRQARLIADDLGRGGRQDRAWVHLGVLTGIDSPDQPSETPADPEVERRWRRLESCGEGTLGWHFAEHYHRNGFTWPGQAGAIHEAGAVHDFAHVVGDYAISPTGECEVFTFWTSSSDEPLPDGGSPIFVFGLFGSGAQRRIGFATARAGVFDQPGAAVKVADAMRRGVGVGPDLVTGTDWFALADRPLDEVRDLLGLAPKGPEALAAGSESVADFHY